MANLDFEQLIIECHDKIRAGRTDLVVKHLRGINTAQIPRKNALALASLCRRAELIRLGLRILKPIVCFDSSLTNQQATHSEKGEYAILLLKNGSLAEAANLLKQIEAGQFTEAHLYLGFAAIMQWNYEAAVSHLENFIKIAPDSFTTLVAKVNLAAALVNTGRFEKAKLQIQNNMLEAAHYKNKKLLANSHELLSQIYIQKGDYVTARVELNRSWEILKDEKSTDQLFVIKWQAIIEALEKKNPHALTYAKNEARKRRHWESVRDLDFYHLKIEFDTESYNRLYCGTPFSAYREKLKKEFSHLTPSPQSCLLGDAKGNTLDLSSLHLSSGKILRPTAQIQKTFKALLHDIYRPQSMGALFETIFPGEYFDSDSSPNRIRQLVNRTRLWLKENYLPAEIKFDHEGFRVVLTGPIQLKLDLQNESGADPLHLTWLHVKNDLSRLKYFTVDDLRYELKKSKSSAQRILSWALQEGQIKKSGRGRATKYEICESLRT